MFRLSSAVQYQPNVTAIFRDGAPSFRLTEGDTLGDLAGRIEALGTRHAGLPISIQVHFESHNDQPVLAPSRH